MKTKALSIIAICTIAAVVAFGAPQQSPTPAKHVAKYWYDAKVEKIIDGDTADLAIDLGFNLTFRDRFRLYGIDAWETRGDERPRGLAAKARLTELIDGRAIEVHTHKDARGKYGRWLATIYVGGRDVNELLVAEGHAERAEY